MAHRIDAAFLYGSLARGEPHAASDVDVVGKVGFGRDINPSVYSLAEFRRKLAQGHFFLQAVWKEPKMIVLGDSGELEGKSTICLPVLTATWGIARPKGSAPTGN